MKRYTLLILTVLMLAPLLPLTNQTSNLEQAQNQAFSASPYSAILVDDNPMELTLGQYFTCINSLENSLKCWGYGGQSRLGTGTGSDELRPSIVNIPLSRNVVQIDTGVDHACVVLDDGSVNCWGQNGNGQVGDGSLLERSSPVQVNLGPGRTAIKIATGAQHTCAILDTGNVSCWGEGLYGRLGNGGTNQKQTPTQTNSLGTGRTAVDITAGDLHTCAILDNGAVSCWGQGGSGRLGNGQSSYNSQSPTFANSLGIGRTAVGISAGYSHTCALLDNGSVSCWGYGVAGQLGRSGVPSAGQSSPMLTSDFGNNRTATAISTFPRGGNTCVILDDGNLSCWGNSGIYFTASNPLYIPQVIETGPLDVMDVSVGQDHICYILADQSVNCYGNNAYAGFGDGTRNNRYFVSNSFEHSTQIWNLKTTSVENQTMSAKLRGNIFDEINATNSVITVEVPHGLTFSNNNRSIHGIPIYTTKTEWNITITNGSQQKKTTYELQILADTDGDSVPNTLDTDDDGDGFGDPTDACPTQSGTSTMDQLGCPDDDNDGYSNNGDAFAKDGTQVTDLDQDGFGDNASGNLPDACPNTYGDSARGGILGCPDADGDRWADQIDVFDDDLSQWNDTDGDGYGDSLIGFQGDACPNIIGTSIEDRFGCIDTDNDGWSDDGDLFSNNPTQWADRDGDGYGDNQEENATMSDAFPADGTQWNDTDEDGHGDNPFGSQGDWFPNDPLRWQDSDQDGFADENDAFPNEITQWNDTDGDGYGDEENGNRGDAFPNDAAEWLDSDMDGLGDNADAFPFDPTQKVDADGDGMGDNPMGIGADKFPDDVTQWGDIDGDGYGDNPNGTSPDAFITDATQWSDEDGDGYGDNPAGRLYDQFPQNPTQWLDEDGDGLGDNQSGTNADPSLNDFDNDGYNDSIDTLPKLASPGDLDNDGVLDVNDLFPDDPREWADYDGDGEGDNADTDDDNDGWADTDEIRLGTDPFGAADVPVDSFEIVIPGTAVGLGAWDLIGMFGGIPLFMWIGFGFVTRNGRTAKYEGLLREAQSRDELEDVARMWEYSLMLRMLGPHQGIRLERLRAELDDRFEAQNQSLSSIEPQQHDQTQMVEQAMQAEQKSLPSIESAQPEITVQGNPDGKGYEWYTDGQETSWYRNEGSNSEWQRFEA